MAPSGVPAAESIPLPDSPVGRALQAYLTSFNSGDLASHQAYIEKHLTHDALRGQTVDQRARSDASFFHWTRGLRVMHVEQVDELKILAHLQSILTDEWFRVLLEKSPDQTDLLTTLSLKPENRPAVIDRIATDDTELASRLSDLLSRLTAADQFSGVVWVTRDSQTIFQNTSGFASLPFRAANQLDTKFNIASTTKIFTAVAISQLAEQGKLNFDDVLSKHLPDYPADVANRVTIHQLLTHTSGLGDYFNARFEAARVRLRRVADFVPLFIDDPLAFEPGSRWSYSNAGYTLLGLVIERITGQDYYDAIRERVFRPAGMSDTDFYEMDIPTPNLAIGYTHFGLDDYFDPTRRRNNLFLHVVKGGPAGGAFSNASDLHNFANALRENRLLSPALTNSLMEGKVLMGREGDRQYGYGLMVSTVDGKRIVGHSGTFPGIGSRLDLYLDHGYTVVILSNYDPHITQAIGNKIREWIAGR